MIQKLIATALLALALVGGPAIGADQKTIYILATGGTIAGKQASPSDPGYKSGSFDVQDLIDAVPPLKDVATLKGEQISNIGSQDMNEAVWITLARRINELMQDDDVDGFVITHGTDTLEETAYFLNLVVRGEKPVVLTASMRPATAISADGPMNLYQSVVVATEDAAAGRGVLVLVNSEFHYAAEVTKTHTVNPATLRSPNRGLAGECDAIVCHFYSPTVKLHTLNSELSLPSATKALPRVDIIYAHATGPRDMIDAAAKLGAKGIVIAGVGDGNMSAEMIAAMTEWAQKGVVIVRSSHVGAGIVKRNVEVDDDKLGFVASMELNPQKARVLLQVALLNSKDVNKIQQYFNQY